MPKSLLIEIGLEEIPARFIRGAAEQLQQKLCKWLSDSRIAYSEVKAYGTPRRIAVIAQGVEDKQSDISEEAKGPSLKIARDEQGGWSKAALGFARSQGVDESDLYIREIANVEYVFARKSGIGTATAEILPRGLSELIQSMTFPKNMRWGSHEVKFIRPIRWLTILFGETVVPLEITGISSGRTSKGHRFLGQDTEISSPDDYVDRLNEQAVIVDIEERQSLIIEQIEQLSKDNNWQIAVKDDLLEEVLFLVEYPTVLFGAFDPSFLKIPQEVLITSMREHQRYFPVFDQNDTLLPFFVTVRNGNNVSIDQVARGNEKVLRARLSDAKFFYEEDQKLKIDDALNRLETIVFHEELGTIADKVRRIETLSARINELANTSAEDRAATARAAHICKFDLVTQMVYEFPELQGFMGEDYARKLGESELVSLAVNEHYMPRFSGDRVPSTVTGAIVSLADKLDTIAGCFAIGIIPTGSQDPYALRRQAAGIVHILLEYEFPVTLDFLIQTALGIHAEQKTLKRPVEAIHQDMLEFFSLRVKNVLSEQLHVRYDVADAVMASGISNVTSVVRKANALMSFAVSENKLVMDAWGRVCNLASKAESSDIQSNLFVEQAEHELHKKWNDIHIDYCNKLESGEEAEALAVLAELRETVNHYFDAVMVMTDDLALRSARLALLAAIAADIRRFADFSRIVW